MIRLFANAKYDFIKWRRWAYGLTALIIIPGLALFLVHGLNYSIEFTGGTLIQVRTPAPVGTDRIRAALDAAGIHDAEIQEFGAPNEYVVRTRRGGRPQGGARAPGQGVPRDLLLVHRHAHLSGVPLRVAVRPRRGTRDASRYPHHDRVHPLFEPRGEPGGRGRRAHHGRLLAQRHHHHLRPRAGEPAQVPAPEPVRDPQSLDQRNAAAFGAHPRDHDGHDAGAGAAGGRGAAAVRPGDDVRHLHRHVLVDLYRRPAAHVRGEALAGAGCARRAGVPPRGRRAARRAEVPVAAGRRRVPLQSGRVTCWSTRTATWATRRSTRTVRRCWTAPARPG